MTIAPSASVLALLDYAGVAVFAATGALAAARRGQTIVTFAFFAAVTGVGGGTLRDLLLGAPVFWVHDPRYVAVCIAVAGLVWALGARRWNVPVLLWLDALGLAAYAVIGTAGLAALAIAVFGPRRFQREILRPVQNAVGDQASQLWADSRSVREQISGLISRAPSAPSRDRLVQNFQSWIGHFKAG